MQASQQSGADREVSGRVLNKAVDRVFDALLAKLGCTDGTDARLISHWQGDSYLIHVTRKSDGRSIYRTIRAHDAAILPPLSSSDSGASR